MWNESNVCLSWDEMLEWAGLLGVSVVPTLYRGLWSQEGCRQLCNSLDLEHQEGLVIRPAAAFGFSDFRNVVGSWLAKDTYKLTSTGLANQSSTMDWWGCNCMGDIRMKLLLIIEADTNDADYVTEMTEVTPETLEPLLPIFTAIKDMTVKHQTDRNHHNWSE